MSYIKKPEGVDFVINGKPLTEKERKAISEFIKKDKERLAKRKNHKKTSTNGQHSSGARRKATEE